MNKFLFSVGTYLDSPLHAPLCRRPLTCPWKVCLVLVIFFLWEWDINPLLNPQPGGARHCNFIHLAPAVQKVDNTIHSINHYPVDSTIGFPNMYPVDSAIQLLNSGAWPFTQNLPNTVEPTKMWGPISYTVQFSGSLRRTNLPSML